MFPVFRMLSFCLTTCSMQPLLCPSLQDKQSAMNERFFFSRPLLLKPTNGNILSTNQALPPSLTWTTDHTCSTDQSKLRNVHRRAALRCTQAALGLSPESHGSRGGGGLVSVENYFLFCNCNPKVHSLLGRVFHRETAELVLSCLRQGTAEHHPPPCTGGLWPGPRPTLPAESIWHPQKKPLVLTQTGSLMGKY